MSLVTHFLLTQFSNIFSIFADPQSMESAMNLDSTMGMGSMPSPPEMKPDISRLIPPPGQPLPSYYNMGGNPMQPPPMSPTLHSPSSSVTSPHSLSSAPSPISQMTMSPPSHPGQPHSTLSNKHICAICGDRASGKHYGVYR